MATKTIYPSSFLGSSWSGFPGLPTYSYAGKSGTGTLHYFELRFPAMEVEGTIDEVKIYLPWNNSATGYGYKASTTHSVKIDGTDYTYSIGGDSGTASRVLTGGYNNSSTWDVRITGLSSNSSSTAKSYLANPYVVITYTPGLLRVRVSGTWYSAQPYVRVSGAWVTAQAYGRASGTWQIGT